MFPLQFRSINKKAEGRTKGAESERKNDKQRNQTDGEGSDIKIPYLGKKRRYKQATKEFSGQVILSLIPIFMDLGAICPRVFEGW